MNSLENDIPKHKKKKKSSISKSKIKAKHKHEYVDCLLLVNDNSNVHKATYCKTCGKIGNLSFESFFNIVPCGDNCNCYKMLNRNEVLEKYKHLEQFYISDVFQKFVSLSKEIL